MFLFPEDSTTMNGLQASPYSPGLGNLATTTPIALDPTAGIVDVASFPLAGMTNIRTSDLAAYPRALSASHAAALPQETGKVFGNDLHGVSADGKVSTEVSLGPGMVTPTRADCPGIANGQQTLGMAPSSGGTRSTQSVLSASSVETLHICASAQNIDPRITSLDGRNHPVHMPDDRSERAQICRDIVRGSLLGTGGRNGTVPFETGREDVTAIVADTARRWTGHPALAGKKEWSRACDEQESPVKFIEKVCERLQQGSRVLPTGASTEWMLRVGCANGMPMHQAMVRADLPSSVGLGTYEWAKLSLGIEQLGERHWEMRHADVMDAAALPASNTRSFTALATLMSSKPPHIAAQRLRNQLTMRGLPTAPADTDTTTDASTQR
ncbi:hypothetical protein [Pandoraea apista]|nr:hypothetical protein [Pandoraea apista]OXS88913.1 hypothetical protein B7H01_24845 [Pandoraea apista]